MRKRSEPHELAGNLELRKRQLEAQLAKVPDAAERERLTFQIRELEAARHMEAYLRSKELRPPE